MDSKLREDLPTHCTKRWDKDDIKTFNLVRDGYKGTVKQAKTYYGDRAFIANGEAATYDGFTRLLVMLAEQGAKVSQLLAEVKANDKGDIKFTRAYDVVTAVYVPEDLQSLHIIRNGGKIAEYTSGNSVTHDLDQILAESWTVPESEDESALEYILWVSRQGKIGFIHNQEETINLGGQTFKRLIVVQPYLPMAAILYSDAWLRTEPGVTLYLEVNCAANTARIELCKNEHILWTDRPWMVKGGVFQDTIDVSKADTMYKELHLPQLDLPSIPEPPKLDLPSLTDLDPQTKSVIMV